MACVVVGLFGGSVDAGIVEVVHGGQSGVG